MNGDHVEGHVPVPPGRRRGRARAAERPWPEALDLASAASKHPRRSLATDAPSRADYPGRRLDPEAPRSGLPIGLAPQCAAGQGAGVLTVLHHWHAVDED